MIENIIEYVATAVQLYIWLWFASRFFGFKNDAHKIGLFITWVVVFLEITFINQIIPYDGILSGCLTVTLIIYARICLKGSAYFHIFVSIFSTAIIFALNGVVILLLSFLSGQSIIWLLTELTVWRIALFILCRVLEYSIFRAVIHMKHEYELTRKEWTLFIAMPLLTWLAVVLMMNAAIAERSVQSYMFCLTLIVIAIDVLIYYFMLKIKQDAAAAAELELLKMQRDNIKATEANMKALYDNTYSVKHDLKNHFLAIKTMAKKHEDTEIEAYADKILMGALNPAQKIMFTDNDVFNAVINTRLEICRQKNIYPNISVENEAIARILTEDIAVLFGNIFDNAIEAAERCEEKIIIMRVRLQGEYVSVCVENSFNAEFSGAGHETSKPNKEEHGYGLKNVQNIVDKYNGTMQCTNKRNNIFYCDILLGKRA